MWKSVVGHKSNDKVLKPSENGDEFDDSWDTDPDFVNSVSEKEQRWGSKTIQGSGRLDSVNIAKLREDVKKDDEIVKQKQYEDSPMKYSLGYGGKYGVQHDRLDKSAVGFDYKSQNEENSNSSKLNDDEHKNSNEPNIDTVKIEEESKVTTENTDESKPITPGKIDFKMLRSRFGN